MEIIFSLMGLLVLLAVAFIIARFILRLTAKAIGCLLTVIIAVGIVAFLLIFVF